MILLNNAFDPRAQFPIPSRAPLAFHKRFSGYSATPLIPLPAVAERCRVHRVFVKDESNRFGLPAFKILGASWAIYLVLSRRFPSLMAEWKCVDELKSRLRTAADGALYAATDGNHGRAVALVARAFGLRSFIFVPDGTVRARIDAIAGEGAAVTVVEGTYDAAVAQAAREAATNNGLLIQDNSWPGYEEIPHYVIEGYGTMFWEIDEQLAGMRQSQPTHVIVQLGNGTFAEAAVRHFRHKDPSIVVIGVEPQSAACVLESIRAGKITKVSGPHSSIMAGMNCDTPSLVSFPALQKGLTACVTISDDRAREAMRIFARSGIVSGETGSAGLGALLELFSSEYADVRARMHCDHDSTILIVSTEGATDPESYKRIVTAH